MKTEEIAHAWVHQTRPSASCPASMSFDGAVFYSYSTAIGRIVKRKGQVGYILNATRFSSSSSEHQNRMKFAIPGYEWKNKEMVHLDRLTADDASLCRDDSIGSIPNTFYITDSRGAELDATPKELFDYATLQAYRFIRYAERPRTDTDTHIATAAKWMKEANKVAKWFGLKCRADKNAIARVGRKLKRTARQVAKAAEVQKQRDAADAKKREREERKRLDQWTRGELEYGSFHNSPTRLRIGLGSKDVVETSRGSTIMLEDARRAFQFVISRRDKGWRANGEQFSIGNYKLNAVNEEGIVAGCTRIAWDEIERFAHEQGWLSCARCSGAHRLVACPEKAQKISGL